MTGRVRMYRRDPADIVPMAWSSPWTPTEEEFTALFLEIADATGWPAEFRYHTHDSRKSTRGFPDWTLVDPTGRRMMFVELKGFAGKASEEQRAWIAAINDAGGEAYLLTTTGDYARDAASIVELLRSPWKGAA